MGQSPELWIRGIIQHIEKKKNEKKVARVYAITWSSAETRLSVGYKIDGSRSRGQTLSNTFVRRPSGTGLPDTSIMFDELERSRDRMEISEVSSTFFFETSENGPRLNRPRPRLNSLFFYQRPITLDSQRNCVINNSCDSTLTVHWNKKNLTEFNAPAVEVFVHKLVYQISHKIGTLKKLALKKFYTINNLHWF